MVYAADAVFSSDAVESFDKGYGLLFLAINRYGHTCLKLDGYIFGCIRCFLS